MLASAELGAAVEGIASYEGNNCSQRGEKFLEKKIFIQILRKYSEKICNNISVMEYPLPVYFHSNVTYNKNC